MKFKDGRLTKKQLAYIDKIWHEHRGLSMFDYRPWLESDPQAVLQCAKSAEIIYKMEFGLKFIHAPGEDLDDEDMICHCCHECDDE